MFESNGLPGQHADAAGADRIREPLIVVLRDAHSATDGHEESCGVDLQDEPD